VPRRRHPKGPSGHPGEPLRQWKEGEGGEEGLCAVWCCRHLSCPERGRLGAYAVRYNDDDDHALV
jgi:hypothetical protein